MRTIEPRHPLGEKRKPGIALECVAVHGARLVRPQGIPTTRATADRVLRRLGAGLAGDIGEAARAAATPRGTSPGQSGQSDDPYGAASRVR